VRGSVDRLRQGARGRREGRMDFSLIRSHVSWCGLAWLIMMSPLLLRGGKGDEGRKRWNEASGRGQEVEGEGRQRQREKVGRAKTLCACCFDFKLLFAHVHRTQWTHLVLKKCYHISTFHGIF